MSTRNARAESDPVVPQDAEIGGYVSADEPVYDSRGNRIDDAYINRAVADVHRSIGRPSLTGVAGKSPTVSFRLPPAERVQAERLAEAEGKTVSQLARDALSRYLAEHPSA